MQLVVRAELMREVSNGRRSPEMVWRREEEMGSSGQVAGRPDLTSHMMSSRCRVVIHFLFREKKESD
jgi:hypothetical protein